VQYFCLAIKPPQWIGVRRNSVPQNSNHSSSTWDKAEQQERLDLIERIEQVLITKPDAQKLAQALVESATRLTRAPIGAFIRRDSHGERIIADAIAGVSPRRCCAS
jgi:hypothetical protein